MDEREFQNLIWEKGRELYRDMPWRRVTDPYYILVSELMLQQTQVDRVIPKFNDFIRHFPDISTLSSASLSEVLQAWQGLGYNRRAKFLHEAAISVTEQFGGNVPGAFDELVRLKGVGANTAGAVLTYAFNRPAVFIETNVRAVYFHHFFPEEDAITDKELRPLVERTLDKEHPREFYWALMDYGSWLKKQGVVRVGQSKHHKKQGALKGSVREIRGAVVRLLSTEDMTMTRLESLLPADGRIKSALEGLERDGIIMKTGTEYHLTR